ncbi:MAG TPA: galactose-1-phosphate uridylyltransferase [Clostridiales bacterium]|nr:galactose-1-phosphate uridylyltransferase [Clostridiales bacterium]HPV01721.1 galactose-1-phosphate uridylyltransferase [Clostridiales bacterium]
MAELRWHPLIRDWVMIASHRQNRPQMPKDWCPFCPGSGRVPDDYEVYKYDNDFPALMQDPPAPDDVATDFYRMAESYGKCEVILFSPEHSSAFHQFSVEHIVKIVDLWTERFTELSKDEKIKYIFIFENRGEMVGVTMPHPHGQIYGYPFIPKKIQLELESCREHHAANGTCLICDMMKDEMKHGDRVIFENDSFVVFLPFFTEYPYGVYIVSKNHKQNLTQFDEREKTDLARALKETVGMLDSLFGFPFPYMMCMHQDPVNSCDVSDYYHFHIEFFPPMRSADRQKFNASSETGAWAHANPTKPEEKAAELREAHRRFLDSLGK